ncbi:MAG: hypothetical protein Q8L57_02500 [bacterium]|nr:hypothetical protein [bacterium]
MTTNELKILEIIWDWGGEASVDIIAREAGISIDYARLLCESLGREGCIDFLGSKLCKIKSKGKVMVAEKQGQNPRKIVIPAKPGKFGLGKDKKGRLLVGY